MTWLWMLFSWLLARDADPPPDDDQDDDDNDTDDDDDEEIRDPKALVKSLRAANDRLAKKVAARDARIKELEKGDGDGGKAAQALRATRLELAFLKAALDREEPITDLDTAFDLARVRGFLDTVTIEDDGEVEGMAEVMDRLGDRYPWLLSDDDTDDLDDGEPKPRTKPVKRDRTQGAESARQLERRFPALRGRRRARR